MELVSILVPVFNERSTLRECIERVLAVELGVGREIVVADDGSTDGSQDVLRELAREHPEVRPVFLSHNRGKGAALAAALRESRGTIAVIQDADLEYDPRDIPRLVAPILDGRADAVYGSRLAAGAERRVLYYRHALGNRLVTLVSNLLTDLNLTDVETGYKAFRTELVKGLPIRSRSFEFEIEITAKLAALGARVYEVPVSYHGRSYLEGKKITWLDGLRALVAAVRFRLWPGLGTERADLALLVEARRLRRFFARLARLVVRGSGQRVLVFLPGAGELVAHLARKERVVCLEPDTARASLLRRRFGHRPNVRVVEGLPGDERVAEALRVERLDTAVCVDALAAVEDDLAALAALARALGPGGKLVLVEPRGEWLRSPLDSALGRLRRYSPGRLRSMLESAGFAVERARSFNRAGTLAHLLWGKLLRRRRPPRALLGFLDRLSLVWRLGEFLLPVPGLSVVIEARVR